MPGDAASPGRLLVQLARLHRAHLTDLLAPHGIHPGQDLLLLHLWETPGLNLADLAGRVGVEAPTVTRMVQRLERGGLVSRERDPDDRRAWRIHPTPRSRLLEASVRRAWQRLDAHLSDGLGETGLERLRAALAQSIAALQADLPAAP